MSGIYVFMIRAVLGVVFGILLMRFFYPEASPAVIGLLCALLVGLSYITGYLHRRKQ